MPDMTPDREEALQRKLEDLEDAYGPAIRKAKSTTGCTDFYVNEDGSVWAKTNGVQAPTGHFLTAHAARRIVNIVSDIDGNPITEGTLNANLPTGERFAAFLPPLVKGISFSVRLPPSRIYTLEEYVSAGIMTGKQADTLRQAVADRMNILVAGGTNAGKAQPDDSLVLTPTGFRRIADLEVGSPVLAHDGKVSAVTGVFPQGEKEIYRITFEDGRTVECCNDHLWKVWTRTSEYVQGSGKAGQKKRGMGWRVVPLSEIRRWFETKRNMYERSAVPLVSPFSTECPPQDLPIPPYALGALIGDGNFGNGSIILSSPDQHVIDRVLTDLPLYEAVQISEGTVNYRLRQKQRVRVSPLKAALDRLGLFGKKSHEKFVPEIYKIGSVEQRRAILQGLLDTDGTTSSRSSYVSYSTTSERLALDVQELAWSLGAIAKIANKQTYFTDAEGNKKAGRPSFVVSIVHPDASELFSLPRKLDKIKPVTIFHRLRITSIDHVGIKHARCIAIDHPDHLYVTNGYVVTHNTTLCNALLAEQPFRESRTCIVQDQNELQCTGRNVVRVFTKAKNIGAVVKEFLRHDPSRIVVGELRDGYASTEWIEACNTGHPGGLSTTHADSAEKALTRVASLSGKVVVTVDHDEIASAIGLVAFIREEPDGSRRLAEIVKPLEWDGRKFITKPA
jgi:Flp pilus assembly CpaF family ATPase